MAVANLSNVVGYVTGLVNAADWLTVDDVSTTASSTTVTSASAAFTQADRGKYVSIANGLGTGKPLITRISSVTNATTIVLEDAATLTMTLATMMYGGVDEDPRHPLWKVTRAVLQKDLEICHAILDTPNHPRRNHFTFTTSTIVQTNTGVPMTNRSGLERMVEIDSGGTFRVGKRLDASWLPKMLTWINNKSSLLSAASDGWYCIVNGQIYFTGDNIRITYVNLTLDATACQAPQEYEGTIALLAAADLFATEGDDLNAAQLLSTLGMQTATALIAKEV